VSFAVAVNARIFCGSSALSAIRSWSIHLNVKFELLSIAFEFFSSSGDDRYPLNIENTSSTKAVFYAVSSVSFKISLAFLGLAFEPPC
jgi:hypothetical protein